MGLHDDCTRYAPEGELCVPQESEQWLVVHCRPRCEKKAAYFMVEAGFLVYLPLQRSIRVYGKRERVFMKPLFPGYVFAVVPVDKKYYIRQNQYVANVIEVYQQDVFVRQLNDLKKAVESDSIVEVLPFLCEGEVVKVLSGPFKGLEGPIITIKGKTRVVISLEMIQQSVSFEVDVSQIAPLSL